MRLPLGVAVAAAVLTLAAPTASADNSLVSSDPADGATLAASPTSLLLTFSEPLGPTNTVSASCNGSPFGVGSPAVSADGLSLTVAVTNMPKGTCNVTALVSAPDSTPNGTVAFSFVITNDPPAAGQTVASTAAPAVPADPTATTIVAPATTGSTDVAGQEAESSAPKVGGPLGLARFVTALALAVLLGALVLIVTAWPEGVEYILTVRFLRTMWLLGLAGSILVVVLLTAQVTGRSIGGSVNPTTWEDLKDVTPGVAALVRMALVAACGWVVIRPERTIDQTTQLPALALPALAVATFGFSRTGGDLAAVGVVAGVVHALAMAVWLGGVVLLARVVLAGPGEDDLVHAVRGFGRIATPAILVTIVSGAVQTYRLDRGEIFGSTHGRVVLFKGAVVVVMIVVALATRQFVRARLSTAEVMTAPLASRLRRATTMEAGAGVVVLMLSAWLLAIAPGFAGEPTDPRSDYGYTQGRFVDGDLDVTVLLTGVVGRNAVRIEVVSPPTGLTGLEVRFVPPLESSAFAVVLTVPPELAGTGAAELPIEEGVPLDAPGVWTLHITATTPTGTKQAQKTFTLLD